MCGGTKGKTGRKNRIERKNRTERKNRMERKNRTERSNKTERKIKKKDEHTGHVLKIFLNKVDLHCCGNYSLSRYNVRDV